MDDYPLIQVAAFTGASLLLMVPWQIVPFALGALLLVFCLVDFFYGTTLTRSARALGRRR